MELLISFRNFSTDVLKLAMAVFANAESIERDCIRPFSRSTWGIIFEKSSTQTQNLDFLKYV